MRTRLIVAFIVVALLAALAALWFSNLIVPFYGWPSWLGSWINGPSPLIKLLYHRTPHHPGTMPHPGPVAVIAFCNTSKSGLFLPGFFADGFSSDCAAGVLVSVRCSAARRLNV